MDLNKTEAYINKKKRINYGSLTHDDTFTFINPLKGSYKDLENKIFQILEINRDAILEIWISNDAQVFYLTNIGVDENAERAYKYAMYPTKKDVIGWNGVSSVTISIARDWDLYKKDYMDRDIIVRGVLRKGYINEHYEQIV